MKLICCLISTILLFTIACKADVNKEIDNLFEKCNNPDSPGCAVAVVKDQKIIYKKSFGSANLNYKTPVTFETVFAGASLSKQFTAFAIALLVEKEKINLNDYAVKYLPWLPKAAKNISVGDLIYHIDGLRDQWDLLTFAGWNLYADPVSNNDILDLVKMQTKLNFIPGSEYLYGNTGYTLLAQIVEKVAGKSFPAFCSENIFMPLEMKNTFFNDNYKKVISNLAESYTRVKESSYDRCPYNISTYGATGIYTNLNDMVKWCNNFFSHKVGGINGYKLITKSGQLKSGKDINYGFGLEIKEYNGHHYIGHDGADAGYHNHFLTFPKENISIIILANCSSIDSNTLVFKIADILLPSNIKEQKEQNNFKKDINYKNISGYYFSKETGTALRISSENKELFVELLGQKFDLKRTDNYEFCVSKIPVVNLSFSNNGNVLDYNNGLEGIIISLTKVKDKDLKIEDLNDYTGKYYCPELNVTYTVKKINHKLILQRPRFVKSQLTPVFKDFFSASNGFWGLSYSVIFIRNKEEKVSGFNISTSIVSNRVRNLHFNKIN